MAGQAPARGRGGRPPGGRTGGTRPQSSAGQRPPRRGRADPARRAACDVLCAVAERDAYANLLLPATLAERGLTGRDAALATELTYGTLRGAGTYDAILAVCSDRDLATLEPAVREILRLGTHQLLATRVAPHAAVATSVDLVRDVIGPRPAGFVNAVLRRVATRDLDAWLEIAAPPRADDPEGYLAIRYSHPRWIVAALADALGEAPGGPLTQTQAALAADGVRPAVTLCAIPGRSTAAELTAAGAVPARWSPYGAVLDHGDPAAIAAVAQGRAGVQDEASQLAAIALARVEVSAVEVSAEVGAGGAGAGGERWLDVCAGPGGKARLLAALAGQADGAPSRLVAAELRPHRARLIRTGSRKASGQPAVLVADGTRPAWRPAAFDRVLADVPCSGLGALRRRPEARWRRSPESVESLGGLQRDLLRTALDSARPGGVVAYVTCSPHLAETRAVVEDVLADRDDVELLDAPAVLPEVPDLAVPGTPYAQFWPHRHGTDAIFLALLRRTQSRS